MKLKRILSINWTYVLCMFVSLVFMATASANEDTSKPELPKGKQTALGLYVTASEAYDKWQADPENITVLDVRTTEEYIFIGHAAMAWNIPLMSQTYEWDPDKHHYAMEPNPNFISQVQELAEPSDTILVTCRSGGRSAAAVNLLAKAGFTNVYNITDGMEGDTVKDPESLYKGQRLKNGWKNSGIPWTYKLKPEQMQFATNATEEKSE